MDVISPLHLLTGAAPAFDVDLHAASCYCRASISGCLGGTTVLDALAAAAAAWALGD